MNRDTTPIHDWLLRVNPTEAALWAGQTAHVDRDLVLVFAEGGGLLMACSLATFDALLAHLTPQPTAT